MTEWQRPEDSMPPSGDPVNALIISESGRPKVIRAAYAAPKTLPLALGCDDPGAEYDEETDTYYCSPGWYETNEFEDTHWKVTDFVWGWMPLPAIPEEMIAR